MAEPDPGSYGDTWADIYDEVHEHLNPSDFVDFLAALAGAGPALELGIGTGRVALPLAASGVEVHGIDASPAMVAKLRAKPGGEAIPLTIGDFTDVPVQRPYPLIFVVFNTFFSLPNQEAQLRCFRGVAAALAPGGVFVVEAMVPDPSRFVRGQRVGVTAVESDSVRIEVARHDPVAQRIEAQHVVLSEAGVRLLPVSLRYAWPLELDLMARLAGLERRDRWGGWGREPFTDASRAHVTVYAPA